NLYGFVALCVLLSLVGLLLLRERDVSWPLAIFVGCVIGAILPSHLAVALLSLVGVGSVGIARLGQSLLWRRRLPVVSQSWKRVALAAGVALVVTVAWGFA